MTWSVLPRSSALATRDPFDLFFEELWRDPFFTEPFSWFGTARPWGRRWSRTFPAVNCWQGEEDVVLTAEIPGVDPESINVSVEADTIKISGRRPAIELAENERFHRRERGYGEFTRVLRLPFRLDAENVEATYRNGVLRIRAPRAVEDRPKRIEVKTA